MFWWRFLKARRNTILGSLIVFGGVCAAVVTVLARRVGDWQLARLGAIASLVSVVLIVVFVVPPLTRSARAEAAQLDLPFQVTAGGWIFLSVYTVVAFAAWNTGNNLLFLIFSVLTSTAFVAWAAARAALRDLVVSARFPDHIFAGEPAPVIVSLHNTKRLLPSFSVLVEARSRTEGASQWRGFRRTRQHFSKRVLAYFMYAPRRARVEQRVEQTFARRGRALVTGFEVSTRFPFGFFRLRRRLRARDVELIIYPKPERPGDELHLLPVDAGQMPSARRGAGHDLHSLRDYQPRDDMRHVDWKATARHSRLIVREFTAEDERRVHIALDTFACDGEESDLAARFERGVTEAASIATHFIDERAELRLTLGDEEGKYGIGREHLYDCLHRLALVAPAHSPDSARSRQEFWQRVAPTARAAGDNYVILLTTAAPGTIPANVWRKSHVIYL
ncbi:MAG: DUF58 domain-containing protein [Acidobacteria bacterium]|nr:DUF58 domain-containing protein [Acidobacteriota bacterium]